MKAVCWKSKHSVEVCDVPEPQIVNPRDAIVKISLTAICGSDLHLYDGYIPTMKSGDIVGHEFMGEVVQVGSGVENLAVGDRVVVPFTISCGRCFFCQRQLFSLCDNSNPKGWITESAYGQPVAGIYGYSHMLGGYAGGQAEYARVPFADVGPIKVPRDVPDEKVLFLSDIFPTAYQAAENCEIREGDTVAVWGCGPVGLLTIRCALLLGASQVIAIDHVGERLAMAGGMERVRTLDFDEMKVHGALMDLTGGMGPDACVDAVGLEAHGHTPDAVYDRVKAATFTVTDRIHALRQAVRACRKGGVLSIPGVYGGLADKFPIGAVFNKGLTVRCGQTHVQRYLQPLLERVLHEEIDPSFVITHRMALEDAPEAYAMFHAKRDHCVKVVLKP